MKKIDELNPLELLAFSQLTSGCIQYCSEEVKDAKQHLEDEGPELPQEESDKVEALILLNEGKLKKLTRNQKKIEHIIWKAH